MASFLENLSFNKPCQLIKNFMIGQVEHNVSYVDELTLFDITCNYSFGVLCESESVVKLHDHVPERYVDDKV